MNNKHFMQEVGLRLKKSRKRMKLTQKQFVKILNRRTGTTEGDYLSVKQISQVESGHSCTSLDKLVEWCLALNKTPDFFLLGIDHKDNTKDNKIAQICDILQLCSDEDIENTLIFVQAMCHKSENIKV